MSASPNFRLSLLAFPQSWDGGAIRLRLLVLPQGDPLAPLLTGAAPAPDSPAFADAKPKLVVHLIPSLDALPRPADATAAVSLATVPPGGARVLFQQLGASFQIAADPPGATPKRTGWRTRKFLPDSYRQAFAFDRPRTPFALTDDTYQCMLEYPAIKTPQPPPPSTVSWGRVIGYALRQPLLATALGLLYEATVTLPQANFFAAGGWLYLGLDPAGDFAPQVAAKPDLLQAYAARIPPLGAARPLFAAVLFPVLATPPAGSYDGVFVEAEDYDDGFAKIVHGAQPDLAAPLNPTADGLAPSADLGIRLGWDDEQVAIWLNRQVDAAEIDAPMGVAGYRIDVRAAGASAWHSMCHVRATLAFGAIPLGLFDGELGVDTVPARHDPAQAAEWWLPSYFAQWRGRSFVVTDQDALRLHGETDPAAQQPYAPVGDTAVPLLYGHSYDVRVRLMDLSRGGPAEGDAAVYPAPAPVGAIPFRRFVPFKPVTVTNPDPGATPAAPQVLYQIARPLLGYPDLAFTGFPNAAAALLADLPAAGAAGREAGLPDPDAVTLQVEVQVRQLAMDAAIFAATDHEPYSSLYTTTRPFPADPAATLALAVSFQDVADLGGFPVQPASGPLVLPRARDLRLIVRAIGKPDPTLAYFGSAAAATGAEIELLTRADAVTETALFVPGTQADRIHAFMLQPDPVPTSNLVAQLALLGASGTTPSDMASRLADALSLELGDLTFSARAGRRAVFGCSKALRHTLSPEHGQLTFAAKTELAQHWIVAITLRLARDWSWDALAPASFEVRDAGNAVIGTLEVTHGLSLTALDHPDRSTTDLIFLDAVDPKPLAGQFPAELNLSYTVTPRFAPAPQNVDPPLALAIHLPMAAKPTQTPALASAGIALSPYAAAADYSSTSARQRALWLEFTEPLDNARDAFFGRVLSYAPDPMLTGDQILPAVPPIVTPPEPPLPVDLELIRTIAPGQSDDGAGLLAMQPLIASDSPLRYMLPLPTGLAPDAPELFGMFVYELRVGHALGWSTAQGRFGPPLKVAGVQHPAPPLLCSVSSLPASVAVTAPYATPVFSGRNLLPVFPRSEIWVLLYAQVTQADGSSQRNVLLDRRPAPLERREGVTGAAPKLRFPGAGFALWERSAIEVSLASLALPPNAPLSVLAVEVLPELARPADPMAADLGQVRILRASPLTPVPAIC